MIENIDNTVIATFGTAIVTPILTYLKISSDRSKTSDKRDAQTALFEKRLADVEVKVQGIDELKDSINQINVSLARIQTILELYVQNNTGKKP